MESSNSKERELQLTQRLVKQRHSHCMAWFEQLETHLRDLYLNSSSHAVDAFKPAFHSFFGEEHQTFRLKMFHNLDQLRLQLERENLLEVNPRTCLDALRTQFKEFFSSKKVNYLNQCWQKDFEEYTLCEPNTYRRDLLETLDTLEAQLQAKTTLICNLKNQIKSVKEARNEAKVKHEIDVLETINIELESSVAKLLAENEKLNKENEHLKQTYKEFYDSIQKTRIQTKDYNESLIAQVNSKSVENADLKAQIQEKVFANVALKNELRKLKRNRVDTKFAKPSILGKPVLQPPRNQSVVRQPNAFKSERPNFSKPRFASQVDVNNVLSKPVTQHYLPKGRV
ncbi:hypothetical protein Tco_1498187 [Tanacetum coccineum]